MDSTTLKLVNLWASKLTVMQIENLPENELLSRVMRRPGHPEQFGFMLGLEYFNSPAHLAQTTHLLTKRLGEVEDLEEKIQKREKEEKELEDQIDVVDGLMNLSDEEKRYLRRNATLPRSSNS